MKRVRLHVIHVEMGKELYGGALQVLYLLNGLKKSAIHLKNTLVCPMDSAICKKAKAQGIDHKAMPYEGELDPRLFLRLTSMLQAVKKAENGAPVVHIHSRRGADLWGPLAAMATATPYIITRRVDNPEANSLLYLKYKKALKVVAISNAIKEILAGYGIEREKIMVIPSGVDQGRYRPGCRDRLWFNREFHLGTGTKAIGMVAQFIPRKRHHLLIEAIPDILKHAPNAVFLFFGKGPLRADMESLARRLKVHGACRFPGFREDMARIFPCLDLLVHPAQMEGLGVSVLQAMACGVPVLASQSGGLKDIIHHQKTAIALNGPDLRQELAQKIPYLLGDESKELRNYMVDSALKLIDENFSIHSMTAKYIRLYEHLTPSLIP